MATVVPFLCPLVPACALYGCSVYIKIYLFFLFSVALLCCTESRGGYIQKESRPAWVGSLWFVGYVYGNIAASLPDHTMRCCFPLLLWSNPLERAVGVGPTPTTWGAVVLPLYYARIYILRSAGGSVKGGSPRGLFTAGVGSYWKELHPSSELQWQGKKEAVSGPPSFMALPILDYIRKKCAMVCHLLYAVASSIT